MTSGIKASGFDDSVPNSGHVDYGTTLQFNCSTQGETVVVGTQVREMSSYITADIFIVCPNPKGRLKSKVRAAQN